MFPFILLEITQELNYINPGWWPTIYYTIFDGDILKAPEKVLMEAVGCGFILQNTSEWHNNIEVQGL